LYESPDGTSTYSRDEQQARAQAGLGSPQPKQAIRSGGFHPSDKPHRYRFSPATPCLAAAHPASILLVTSIPDTIREVIGRFSDHAERYHVPDDNETLCRINRLVYDLYGLTDDEIWIVEEGTQ